MNIHAMLETLKREREQLDEAIVVLQRLAAGKGARRGRPPSWMQEIKKAAAAKKEK